VVTVEVDDAETCVNTTANVPVRVINGSAGAENVTLNCTVNGVLQAPVAINNLAAGDTAFASIPVLCDTVETVTVSCTATASLVLNPACTDEATDTGTVTCREALVDLALTSGAACVGDTVRVPVTVTNASSEAANLNATYTVDGVPGTPQAFPACRQGSGRSRWRWSATSLGYRRCRARRRRVW
jgi:hypothetical protein